MTVCNSGIHPCCVTMEHQFVDTGMSILRKIFFLMLLFWTGHDESLFDAVDTLNFERSKSTFICHISILI